MEYCEKNPGDVEKVAGLKEQVKEVQSVMLSNIDAVWLTLLVSIPFSFFLERKINFCSDHEQRHET